MIIKDKLMQNVERKFSNNFFWAFDSTIPPNQYDFFCI